MTPGSQCRYCNETYKLQPGNAVVYYFDCQPWFSHALTTCPNCNSWDQVEQKSVPTRMYYRDSWRECMEYFICNEFDFLTQDFAPDGVVAQYEMLYDLRPVEQYELNPRHEKEAIALYEWLMAAPDEWVSFMFEEQAPAPERPERWC